MKKISKLVLVSMMLTALFSVMNGNASSTGVAKTAWFQGDEVILYVNVSNVGETTIVETMFTLEVIHETGGRFIAGSVASMDSIAPGEIETWEIKWNSSDGPLGVYDLELSGEVTFSTAETDLLFAEELQSFTLVRNGTGEAEVYLYYSFVDLPPVDPSYFLGQGLDIYFELNNSGNVPFSSELDFWIRPAGGSNWTSIGQCTSDTLYDIEVSEHCYCEDIPLNTTPGHYDWELHIMGYGGNMIRDYVYQSSEPIELKLPDPEFNFDFELPPDPVVSDIFDIIIEIDNTGNVPLVPELSIHFENIDDEVYHPTLLWGPDHIAYPGMNNFTTFWLLPDNLTTGNYTCYTSVDCHVLWPFNDTDFACLDADMNYCTEKIPSDPEYWLSPPVPSLEVPGLFNYEKFIDDNDFFAFTIDGEPVDMRVEEPQLTIQIDAVNDPPTLSPGDDFQLEIDWSSEGNTPCLPIGGFTLNPGDTAGPPGGPFYFGLDPLEPGIHTMKFDIGIPPDTEPGDYTGTVTIKVLAVNDRPSILPSDLPISPDIPGAVEIQTQDDLVHYIEDEKYGAQAETQYSFPITVEASDNQDENNGDNQGGIPGYPTEAIILSLLAVIYLINRRK